MPPESFGACSGMLVRWRRLVAAGVIAAVCATGVVVWFCFKPDVAPELEMTTVRGERLRLSEFRDDPILIVFWASDCGPCIGEIPELIRLDRELSGRGFHVIAVAMAYDLPSRVLSLIASAGVSYRVILDLGGRIAAAFGQIRAVPTAVLIGPDGVILDRISGPLDFTRLRVRLLPMLRDP